MSIRSPLPTGWTVGTIGDLISAGGVFCDGDWVETKDQDPDGDMRLTQLADVGVGQFLDKSNRYLTSDSARRMNCTILEPGDVLVARMPEPIARACVFPGDSRPCVTVVDVCIVRTNAEGIDPRWLMSFLNSPPFTAAAAGLERGSTRKRISRRNLATIELPVPPANEQRRIADKLDELLSQLDAGVAALSRVQANLKRYRAAVLKAAVEGRLTAQWRAEQTEVEPAAVLLERILADRRRHWSAAQLAKYEAQGKRPPQGWQAKYKEPEPPETDGLPELPEGWTKVELGHLVAGVEAGKSIKCSTRPARPDEWGIVKVSAMSWGEFLADENKALLPGTAPNPNHEIREGDLLVSRSNTSDLVGASVLVGECRDRLLLSDKSLRLVVPDSIERRWLWLALSAPQSRRHLSSVATGTSDSMRNISQPKLLALRIDLPPIDEQRCVVAQVEEAYSCIDAAATEVDRTVARATRLRQSILKQAFEGKLVPQDPSDEPAAVLLARIAAERGQAQRRGRMG